MRLPKLRIPKRWVSRAAAAVVVGMTVSYQYEVASSTSGGFTRLLFMWRGSLYKLIYRELLLFCVAFALLSAAYRNLFTDQQKRLFEKVVVYCDTFIAFIPLSFVLGFYVAYVAGRWWQQYVAIPWPDKVMHTLALYVGGNDVHDRMIRRTLMRYLNLSLTLVLRSISSAVKRRFPTMDHLVEAGFMTSAELQMFQAVPNLEFNTYWIPCTWFIALLKDTKRSNLITDSQGLQLIVEEFNEFRSKCGLLWSYDWISIPLVYTQVVTLATYSFFLAALVGRQYVDGTTSLQKRQFQMEVDIYIPLFTILQFFFYMGLLKVAEQLINPFGDDDEDFELNWLIDRHIKVSYLGVDTLMARYPPLMKDKYFDEINLILPYTGAAFAYKKKTYRGSVHNMQVPEDQQSMFLPEISEEAEEEYESHKRESHSSRTSSFTNLIHAVSPSAGIWRSNADKSIQAFNRDLEEGFHQDDIKTPLKLERFTTKAPWKSQKQHSAVNMPSSRPTFASLNLTEWSSHSTLDSVDSILPNPDSSEIKSSNPFELSFEQETDQIQIEDSIPTMSASRSSIPLNNVSPSSVNPKIQKFSSTGNIALSLKNSFNKHFKDKKLDDRSTMKRMFGRRPSSSSGQWKGVRWKPVIDDSAGDTWSDNSHRRPSSDVCNKCKDPLTATEPPSHCSSSDNVTASFQSLNSEQSSDFPRLNFTHKERKRRRSNSLFVNSDVKSVDNGSNVKSSLTASSLPNICLVTANSNGRFDQINVPNTASEDHPHNLNVLQKSYSTSPRAFSRLQETITEENESRH